MAHIAIKADVRYRMAGRLSNSYQAALSVGNTMAGIAPSGHYYGVVVVGVGIQKTNSSMTVTAFSVGNCMAFVLTSSHSAVVATRACPGNIRMIKAAVRCQVQKTGGIVAVIAFDHRRRMKVRFSDGYDTIMAFAAISKYFLMIGKGDDVKSLWGMAGLAVITGGDVSWRFRKK